MSQQTAIPLTPEQAREADTMARRRALLNRGAATVFVRVIRDGQPATVPLTSLPPTERAKVMQKLLSVPDAGRIAASEPAAIPAPAVADAPASSGTAPSRFTTRMKKTTTSATKAKKKARKK